MNIGRAAIAVFLICLLAFSMIAILSIVKQDQSNDPFYVSSYTTTINRTVNLTENIEGMGYGLITPLPIVIAILFLLAAFLIFRRL
jgi:hypothetical protein